MTNHIKTILLVDDEPDITNTIVSIFEDTRWTFYQARNGEQGFAIAQAEKPDLIITDWEMPVCNGLELIKKLKADSSTSSIAIIMLTGMMTTSQHLKKALALGANDFISKPINKIELEARVLSVLNLFDANKQRIEAQQKAADLKKQYLEKELGYSKEMVAHKVCLQAAMSGKINEFVEVLNGLRVHCNKEGIKYIEDEIKQLHIEKKENIELEFFAFFEQSYPSFFTQLKLKYPDLTPKEQKICALIMMDLNNKHIAQFFSNSESTIKTTRKLLRRKLGIIPDIDLNDYLKSI